MTLSELAPSAAPAPPPDEDDERSEPWFARLARFSARRRRAVILVWLVATIAAAPLAVTLTGALSGAGWEAQGSTAVKVRDELRRDFPQLGAEAAVVVYRQPDPIADDPSGVQALVDSLGTAPGAAAVVDPLSRPPEAGLVSPDGRTVLIPVQLEADEDADLPLSAEELIGHVDEVDLPEGAEANVTGEWAVWSDFNTTNEEALHRAELFSALPTIILLLIAFGSAIAAGIPLLLALAGIAVGFASLHLLGNATPLSVWSMNFSMMIGLAVGIDYSLFIVSRYREEREDGYDAYDAIANTLTTAGKAVFLSALTVVLSLAAVFVVPVMVFRSMALGMILAVVAVALAALTLLPAVLVALGDRVLVARGHEDPDRAAEGRWAALDRPGPATPGPHPVRRPGPVAVAGGTGRRHAVGHAGRPGRRHRRVEPRRLRDGGRVVRPRRRGPSVHHRARRRGGRSGRRGRQRSQRGRRRHRDRACSERTHGRAGHPGVGGRRRSHVRHGRPLADRRGRRVRPRRWSAGPPLRTTTSPRR